MRTAARYYYLGDRLCRLSGSPLVGQPCRAVLDARGRCIRGRNGSMLVEFASGRAVVMARQLRKLAPSAADARPQSTSSTSTAVEPPASSSVTSSSS